MRFEPLHEWDLSLDDAKALQRKLAASVRSIPLANPPRLIAGADVAVSSGGSLRFSHGRASSSGAPTQVFAAVVVWDAVTRAVVETKTLAGETRFPYIRLIGSHETPGATRGSQTPLIDNDEVIGAVLRTRANVNPVYVSPGHLIDITDATRLVLLCASRFRLPEPTRLADQLSKRAKRGEPHHV